MNILQICPPHLSYVANLPWEIQKSRTAGYVAVAMISITIVLLLV